MVPFVGPIQAADAEAAFSAAMTSVTTKTMTGKSPPTGKFLMRTPSPRRVLTRGSRRLRRVVPPQTCEIRLADGLATVRHRTYRLPSSAVKSAASWSSARHRVFESQLLQAAVGPAVDRRAVAVIRWLGRGAGIPLAVHRSRTLRASCTETKAPVCGAFFLGPPGFEPGTNGL